MHFRIFYLLFSHFPFAIYQMKMDPDDKMPVARRAYKSKHDFIRENLAAVGTTDSHHLPMWSS